jgi:enamine deaminase RidA (YjgF/YER057c/UK114 family)
MEAVYTSNAPKPLPQFSQAVKYNGMVYCSGNIGMSPETWKVVEGTVKDRTVSGPTRQHGGKMRVDQLILQRQALRNLSAVLDEAGSSLKNVVKMNIFLTSMDDFAAMNEAYDEFFTADPKPVGITLETMQTTLPTDNMSLPVPYLCRRLPATVWN